MQDNPGPDPKALKAELVRLRIKRSETEDKDIRNALDERIKQLEAQVVVEPPEDEPEIPVEPPTPQQLAEAENLVRQARVEKMRGNGKGAGDLLKQASEVAPGAPAVLEVVADDLAERKQFDRAKKMYRQAWKLDPKNVGLERKYAMIVAQMDAMGSIDDQLRANLSDSPFINESEALASANAAIIMSAVFPGLGHAVLGKGVGYPIMLAWLVCSGWLFFMKDDLAGLFRMAAGSGTPNLAVMVPLLLMAVIYLGTIASLKTSTKSVKKRSVEHPRPPVDLPFD
jgi:hypothetical protein